MKDVVVNISATGFPGQFVTDAEKASDAKVFPNHFYYKVESGVFVAFLEAEELLHWMKEYEARIKDGSGDRERREPNASSSSSGGSINIGKGFSFGNGVYGEAKSDSIDGSLGEEAA